MEILWKRTLSAEYRVNHSKICRNCAFPQNFESGNWVKLWYFMQWLLTSYYFIGCLFQISFTYEMLCAVWYHLYNLKNVKSTHRGELRLAKFQGHTCNFTKSSTPPCVFVMFFKLYKWYQIAQSINIYLNACSKSSHSDLFSKTRAASSTFLENTCNLVIV